MSPIGLSSNLNTPRDERSNNIVTRQTTTTDKLGSFHAVEFKDTNLKSSKQLPLMNKAEVQKMDTKSVVDINDEKILQNKSDFIKKINGGENIILKVPSYKENSSFQGYVFIDLNKLDKESRADLINGITEKIDKFNQDPHRKLTGISFKFPYYEVIDENNNKKIDVAEKKGKYSLGGFDINFANEDKNVTTTDIQPKEKKENFNVNAKDLSKITSLDNQEVIDLVKNTTNFIKDKTDSSDIKLTRSTGDNKDTPNTITPTVGFNLNDVNGKKQVRAMLDGYLKAGGFDKDLYKTDSKYKQKVNDGIAEMIKGGFNDTIKSTTRIPNEKALCDSFVKAIFEKESLTSNDIKTIQAGFAAMSKNNPEFSNIINMKNPETGELPKDQGIDGIPATRFAVVTSTLFAKMEEKIKPEIKTNTTTVSKSQDVSPVTLKDFESFDKELKLKDNYAFTKEELKSMGK
ncbi:MAG: hypothetical protein U0354_04545 [Candidatus Sericytochromatia bacterium]